MLRKLYKTKGGIFVIIKMRLQGLPDQMGEFVKDLKKKYRVLSVSEPYPNRRSEYVRVYVEVEFNG